MAYMNSDHISCLKIGTQSDKHRHISGIHQAEFCNQGQAHKILVCHHPAHLARFPGPSSGDLIQQAWVVPENLYF